MSGNLPWCMIVASAILSCASCYLQFEPKIIEPLINECKTARLWTDIPLQNNVTIDLDAEFARVAEITPKSITVEGNSSWQVQLCGKDPGLTTVLAKIQGSNVSIENEGILHVVVGKTEFLKVVSFIVGWIYFTACAISFYPQMYENYRRQSVVGLNFDYCILNIVGFFAYSLYNIGLLYIKPVEKEYFRRHPTGLNPVQVNDLLFSTHGFFAAVVTMYQCFIYERSNQRVTTTAKLVLLLYATIVLSSGIAAYTNLLHWLDFLIYCSLIKLSITVIKYIPQAIMNYRRKSTVGWSIFNVILDFNGGAFSFAQMLVIGYNFNDWESIFGDPTKFGLGLVSIAFDTLFIYQHYVLYKPEPKIDKIEI